jgi:hypothetical protein
MDSRHVNTCCDKLKIAISSVGKFGTEFSLRQTSTSLHLGNSPSRNYRTLF